MPFTRRQQGEFRQLVAAAWREHCGSRGLAPGDPEAQRAWYEEQLEEATGHASTKLCTPGRDYESAMAHFEALSGEGVKWQVRAAGGDRRRLLWVLDRIGFDPAYVRRVSLDKFGLADPKRLSDNCLKMLVITLENRRRTRAAAAPQEP